MKKTDLNELFAQAEEDYNRAKNELYRPQEDVVPFSACVFTRHALYKYLQGLALIYAEDNDEAIHDDHTIENLIRYINQYSDELKDIDFSQLHCKCQKLVEKDEEEEDLVYCTSVDKVNYCSELSENVRELLVEKRPALAAD